MFTLIPVPFVFLGTWFYWRKVYPRYYRLWDASSKQMSVLSGMLSGIRVVKAFAQEDREYGRFQNSAEHLRDWRLWVEHASARYSATMQIVFSLGGLIVWYVGGRDVIGSQMTLGELIAFLAYLSMFYAPLGAISNFTTWLTSFLSGSKRVMELLDTPIDVIDQESPVPWNEPRGHIQFDNVTFGYDHNHPVLKDISFEVAPGEMVGIVGRSGSGKTTMVNLLGRFYDAQQGAVVVDGIDLRELSVHQLRERLGIVFQDSYLFRGTIWDNLSYGRPSTTIEEGLAAAKAAGAHDFVCRSQLGYETQLGESGSGLSGGERQRLSIARTLLYDPKILVLDEATSNIDAESEKSIQEALEVLIRGRTTVAIAHRLSTLRNADRILVFDRGRLVEQGSHAELLASDGVYARLVRIQTQVSKDPNVDRLIHHNESFSDEANESARESNRSKSSANRCASGRGNRVLANSTTADSTVAGTATLVAQESRYDETEGDRSEVDKDSTDDTDDADQDKRAHLLDWLDPEQDAFSQGDHEQLRLSRNGSEETQGVFLVRAFPASHPQHYLSVRAWTEDGDDVEVGLIRDMKQWPRHTRQLLERSIDRRYLLRAITRVHSLKLAFGFLDCDVETKLGRTQFTMRWTQSKAIPFGAKGKLLIDVDENRFVVHDVDKLEPRDRERFLQFIYW